MKKTRKKYSADNFPALFPLWHYPTGIAEARCYNPACCHSGIQIESSSLSTTWGLQLSKCLTVFSSSWPWNWERFQWEIGMPPPTPHTHRHTLSYISGWIIDKDSHSGMTLIAAPKPFEKWFACHFSYCCPLYDAHVSRETTRLLIQRELGGLLNGHKFVVFTWTSKCSLSLHYMTVHFSPTGSI